MSKLTLQESIAQIKPDMWETSLPIGTFHDLEIDRVISRPFSRVARCVVKGADDTRAVFVKVYRNVMDKPSEEYVEKIQREYDITKFWYDLLEGSDEFRVVKPVLALPEKFIFVSEESKGENLFDIITGKAGFFPSNEDMKLLNRALLKVGNWLRYKESRLEPEEGLYSIPELLDYINVRLEILKELPGKPFPDSYSNRIRSFFERYGETISDTERRMTITHSDFNPGNILIGKDNVTVLDFGRRVTESYLLDVCKLHFQLYLLTLKPQFRSSTIAQLQQSLLEGFGDIHADEKLMFRFLTIRNVVTHLTNILRSRQQSLKARVYNKYVLNRELTLLDQLLKDI